MYLTLKAIFAFRAIHRFAFLYRTLNFTHNLKKNLKIIPSIFFFFKGNGSYHFTTQGKISNGQ